jgi:hypothetical protein
MVSADPDSYHRKETHHRLSNDTALEEEQQMATTKIPAARSRFPTKAKVLAGRGRLPTAKQQNAVVSSPTPAAKQQNAVVSIPTPALGSIIQLFGKLVDPSGQPAAGVGVALGFKQLKVNIANTVSDSNGAFVLTYLSTSVPSSLQADDVPVLYLSVNSNPVVLVTTTGSLDLSALAPTSGSTSPATIYGPIHIVTENAAPAAQKNVAPRARLLGDNATLLAAFKRAPGIFTRPVSTNATGGCGPAAPSDMATRVYYLNQFVVFADNTLETPQAFLARSKNIAPINFLQRQPAAQTGLRWGAMIQFQQEWWDLGFSLGDLLYSIPLAPGEETNIATVDWRRQDYAQRSSTLDESSFQDTTITRDQAVDEAVNMHSDKNATDTTGGGGIGISYGPLSIGGAGQYQDMNMVADATTGASNNINDKIHQASITTRQTKAYSIVETTQQEQATVSTRVLRNHNHCHTITFQYFEVLRQYRISTKPISIRPIVLVPFSPSQFTANEVLQYGYILRRGLVDTTLQPVLDEFLGVTSPAVPTATSSAAVPVATTAGSFSTFQATAFFNGNVGLTLLVDDDITSATGPSSTPGTTPVKWTFTFQNAKQFPGIQKIGLQYYATNPSTIYLDNLEISAVDSSGATQLVYFNRNVQIDSGRTFVDLVSSSAIPTVPSGQVGPDLTRLINHLNANNVYYSNLIIAAGDAASRYVTLASPPYNMAQMVDNVVIGTLGNYLAFPLSSTDFLPVPYQGDTTLPPVDAERLITLPTPGIFAESQMGSCTACETIDDTTFWDWQKSPTPENAPDISAAMLASRFQDLSSMTSPTQSNLQAPPVQIPSEPAPLITIGDQTMASLVSNLNLTNASDITSLINGLVSAAAQGYNSMVKAQQGSPGMTSGGDGTGGNGTGGTGAGSAGDTGANLAPSEAATVPTDAITAAA